MILPTYNERCFDLVAKCQETTKFELEGEVLSRDDVKLRMALEKLLQEDIQYKFDYNKTPVEMTTISDGEKGMYTS